MRYVCPSCGRWVRPEVEVIAVTCLHCNVYARREEEEQPALLPAAALEPEAANRGGRKRPDRRRQ
ncbi:hypothetical protein [Oceanithermus sp.]